MTQRVPRAPRTLLAAACALALAAGAATRALAETAHIHVKVETRGAPGEQVSRFFAFTTTDEAGTERLVVSRICVRGVGHQVEERCEENGSSVEVVERTLGLPGVGSRCVEAIASAVWKTIPLSATARACP